MRINTNIASLTANKDLWKVEENVNTGMARRSSGLRIVPPSARDEAAGPRIADNLRINAIVNQAAAESAIRDVHAAQEMALFAKHQVLAQARNALVLQANQSLQIVPSLLR